MIGQPFEFLAPSTLDDVLAALDRPGGAKLLAGGMSLVPAMNLGLPVGERIVSLNHVGGLAGIERTDDAIRIGAMTRHREIASDPGLAAAVPALAEAAQSIGDVQVRNRGTIGGSVAHADPAADYLPVLAASRASFVLRSANGVRTLACSELLVGALTTSVRPDEVLTEVVVPLPPRPSGSAYRCLKRLEGSFAIVNAAAVVDADGATVSVGGAVAVPVVFRIERAPGEGDGRLSTEAGERAFEACAEAFESLAGDAPYKRGVARVYARRAVEAAAGRAA